MGSDRIKAVIRLRVEGGCVRYLARVPSRAFIEVLRAFLREVTLEEGGRLDDIVEIEPA